MFLDKVTIGKKGGESTLESKRGEGQKAREHIFGVQSETNDTIKTHKKAPKCKKRIACMAQISTALLNVGIAG